MARDIAQTVAELKEIDGVKYADESFVTDDDICVETTDEGVGKLYGYLRRNSMEYNLFRRECGTLAGWISL